MTRVEHPNNRCSVIPLSVLAALNPASAVPMYAQLAAEIEKSVLAGALNPGARIDSAERVHRQCRMSVKTVNRAFNELAARGVLIRTVGVGTTVASSAYRSTARSI